MSNFYVYAHYTEETKLKISKSIKKANKHRKIILWVEKKEQFTANQIAEQLNSHPQSIRQAAREGILHKNYRFQYV